MAEVIPGDFLGHSTVPIPSEPGGAAGAVVTVTTVRRYFAGHGIDTERALEPADWLILPEQTLRSVTAGRVFRGDLDLEARRARLAYYPRDIWLYQLAAAWNRIGQEEHLMGRAGFVGDEIGSAIIGARLARDLMRLCFHMEQKYAPYPKWFGTAFAELACSAAIGPILRMALAAMSWQEREEHLCAAYTIVAEMHNRLGVTQPIPIKIAEFLCRPFSVVHQGGGFAEKLVAQIEDAGIRSCQIDR